MSLNARRSALLHQELPDADQGKYIPLTTYEKHATHRQSDMLQLARILYSVISTTLAGTAVIVVLVAGYGTLKPILMAAALGFVAAAPISWAVARRIYS
jgi:hypothetical protein